jgi:hypothetical protein
MVRRRCGQLVCGSTACVESCECRCDDFVCFVLLKLHHRASQVHQSCAQVTSQTHQSKQNSAVHWALYHISARTRAHAHNIANTTRYVAPPGEKTSVLLIPMLPPVLATAGVADCRAAA